MNIGWTILHSDPFVRLTPLFIVPVSERHLISMTTRKDMIPSRRKLKSNSASLGNNTQRETAHGAVLAVAPLHVATGHMQGKVKKKQNRILGFKFTMTCGSDNANANTQPADGSVLC